MQLVPSSNEVPIEMKPNLQSPQNIHTVTVGKHSNNPTSNNASNLHQEEIDNGMGYPNGIPRNPKPNCKIMESLGKNSCINLIPKNKQLFN